MGLAMTRVLSPDNELTGLNSRDFDAADFDPLGAIINGIAPELIINTVALQGIDRCELEPERAFRINTLFPGYLSGLCETRQIMLVHFSSDAVFTDIGAGYCTEDVVPSPLNVYGVTKYGGDCLVAGSCRRHYVCRLPLLFGESSGDGQFVEKMLTRLRSGTGNIRVAADVFSSPSFSLDIADRVRELIRDGDPYGTYHLANEGIASLHELMTEIAAHLLPESVVVQGSYLDFPFKGRKNLCTPLRSVKIGCLRPWREAVGDYCRLLRESGW
jgi:dTDP-4-dehydrorhamnose reductase